MEKIEVRESFVMRFLCNTGTIRKWKLYYVYGKDSFWFCISIIYSFVCVIRLTSRLYSILNMNWTLIFRQHRADIWPLKFIIIFYFYYYCGIVVFLGGRGDPVVVGYPTNTALCIWNILYLLHKNEILSGKINLGNQEGSQWEAGRV